LLKLAILFPVAIFGPAVGFKAPYFPAETATPERVVSYFATHSTAVLILAFLQFGSAIPLGIFGAVIVSQLRFLGVRAAAFDSSVSAFAFWVLARPGFAQDATLLRALARLRHRARWSGLRSPHRTTYGGRVGDSGLHSPSA